MNGQNFIKIDDFFIVDADFADAFKKLGLNSIDDVFSFIKGEDLSKKNLASFRSRIKIETDTPQSVLFLKRYNKPPVRLQLKNWLAQKKRLSFGRIDFEASLMLQKLEINNPKVIACGEEKGFVFEKRSFCITEQIPNAESIERKLPDCFSRRGSENQTLRKKFIKELAEFIKKFHDTGCRHRDLYFSHIFYNDKGVFYLIDLSRVFKPLLTVEYFRVKDIAELNYSAPKKYFSNTDRIRFYFEYSGCSSLSDKDKSFIKMVLRKTGRIKRHDEKKIKAANQ